jgi:hypothetical protein
MVVIDDHFPADAPPAGYIPKWNETAHSLGPAFHGAARGRRCIAGLKTKVGNLLVPGNNAPEECKNVFKHVA